MFHRTRAQPIKSGKNLDYSAKVKEKKAVNNARMDQSAVRQYAKSQEEMPKSGHSSNQNSTAPFAVKKVSEKQETKEAKPMNNPESSSKNPSQQGSQPSQGAQGRVDIPGSNFQRPGAPAQASRPSYPGSYPGAPSTPSYGAQSNDAAANGRQLLIGSGITLSGEIESCDHLVVEGTIEAALKGASQMDIAESGAFFGTVEIENADIAGRFEGDITVKGRLTIQSTGIIIGTVSYKELSMEAGAILEGSVSPINSAGSASQQGGNRKSAPAKSKKVSQDNSGAELPFSDRTAAAAE